MADPAATPDVSVENERIDDIPVIVNMLEGEFELVVEGNPLRLVAGDVVVLNSNVEHAGRADSTNGR